MDEDYNPEDKEHNLIAPIETHRTTVIPAPIQVEPVMHVENDFEKNKKRREAELHFVENVRSEVSKDGVCNQNCESMVFFDTHNGRATNLNDIQDMIKNHDATIA